jgi:multicomponent Na+:H+ antiporter subunit E
MNLFGWNLGLALVWCALLGRLTVVDLGVGFAIGYVLLGWLLPDTRSRAYRRRLPLVVAFLGYYAVEVIVSSLRIAWEVVTPRPRRQPGIIPVPLDVDRDL